MTRQSGSQFFYCCYRVNYLEAGQTAALSIRWPSVFTEKDLPPGASREMVYRSTKQDSFALVLPRLCVQSSDMRDWRPIDGVESDGLLVTIPLRGTSAPLYVATQVPYTPADYDSLLQECQRIEPGTVAAIGASRAGWPIHAVTLPATGDAQNALTVFVQGYQHATEFSGPIVCDAMIRFLLSEEGRKWRERVTFQFIPVFDMDGLHYLKGYYAGGKYSAESPRRINPNRDWAEQRWPEVRVVDAFLRKEIGQGRNYAIALDLHNGWDRVEKSGACYTVACSGDADAAYIERQKHFADWMYSQTDHTKPGVYWQHAVANGKTFVNYMRDLAGALTHTVEFSRHIWWNRATQSYEPAHPRHPIVFARDAAIAIAKYLSEN